MISDHKIECDKEDCPDLHLDYCKSNSCIPKRSDDCQKWHIFIKPARPKPRETPRGTTGPTPTETGSPAGSKRGQPQTDRRSGSSGNGSPVGTGPKSKRVPPWGSGKVKPWGSGKASPWTSHTPPWKPQPQPPKFTWADFPALTSQREIAGGDGEKQSLMNIVKGLAKQIAKIENRLSAATVSE